MKYEFIRDNRREFSVKAMCRIFTLNRSNFYAWLTKPLSNRANEYQRLLKAIRKFSIASGATYGSPWIHRDLCEEAETCSVHRVAKIMRQIRIKAQIGYKRRYMKRGKLASVADNLLNRKFDSDAPNKSWVSDIIYIHTYEGFLYVATVLNLFSRGIVGWSTDKNMDRHLVIRALMMAVWKRQNKERILVHSDQGSQYGSAGYLSFLKGNNLEPSMRRRGNCHDNAVAESFFATFKKRVTQRKIYTIREDAKTEIFNFIELFYSLVKRHSHAGSMSPVKFEEDYYSRLESV